MRPLTEQSLPVALAVAEYCVASGYHRVTSQEFQAIYPELWWPGSRASNYVLVRTDKGLVLRMLLVDRGGAARRIRSRVRRVIAQRSRLREFSVLMKAGRFEIVVLTGSTAAASQDRPPHRAIVLWGRWSDLGARTGAGRSFNPEEMNEMSWIFPQQADDLLDVDSLPPTDNTELNYRTRPDHGGPGTATYIAHVVWCRCLCIVVLSASFDFLMSLHPSLNLVALALAVMLFGWITLREWSGCGHASGDDRWRIVRQSRALAGMVGHCCGSSMRERCAGSP